ncbi:MAG: hypothetical protein M3325_16060 [Actinomycetota bacterium]|nr:hypothetical protein [Actinomycetota bacterium]
MGGYAFGVGLVDGVDERCWIDPGFDGGLVAAQLGLGIGQSAPGVLELSIGQ